MVDTLTTDKLFELALNNELTKEHIDLWIIKNNNDLDYLNILSNSKRNLLYYILNLNFEQSNEDDDWGFDEDDMEDDVFFQDELIIEEISIEQINNNFEYKFDDNKKELITYLISKNIKIHNNTYYNNIIIDLIRFDRFEEFKFLFDYDKKNYHKYIRESIMYLRKNFINHIIDIVGEKAIIYVIECGFYQNLEYIINKIKINKKFEIKIHNHNYVLNILHICYSNRLTNLFYKILKNEFYSKYIMKIKTKNLTLNKLKQRLLYF